MLHRENAASGYSGLVLQGVSEEARQDVVDTWSCVVHADRMNHTTDIASVSNCDFRALAAGGFGAYPAWCD
jgi:hypothetical protein